MTSRTIWTTPRDEAHWLEMREKVVSSTESAALFSIPLDVRPRYLPTAYRLWHEKHQGHENGFKDTTRTRRGKHMEWAIAQEIAAANGWSVEPFKDYAQLSDVRMGASFDAEVICPKLGRGLMECKLVDPWIFEKAWTEEEAPPHIEIQVQHQLEVADRWDWACMAAWSGTEPKWLIAERDREMGAAIRNAVDDFWKWNDPPPPDFLLDADTIRQVLNTDDGGELDLSDDEEVERLCKQYKAAGVVADEATADKVRASSELLLKIGHAKKVMAKGFKITTYVVPEQKVSFKKLPYRAMRITQAKGKS